MRQILVNITDPSKEKLVTDILHEIAGVEVQRAPTKTKRTARHSKVAKWKKALTPSEQKFVKGLTRAFKEMNEHIAGKRKLKSLKEVLDGL